jgi:hypothetical protein
MVGRKHNMMIEIATVGDFTTCANCTDVTVKIPTAGMACKIANITTPSCCKGIVGHCACKNKVKCFTREAPAAAAMCKLMVYSINVRVATARPVDPVID